MKELNKEIVRKNELLRMLDNIRGIDKNKEKIKNYIKYVELNKNTKINYGNLNVLINCNSEFIEAEKLVELIEECLRINNIISSKQLYITPNQLKNNLNFNEKNENGTQLIIVSSEFIDLNYEERKKLEKCIEDNKDKIFIVLYKYEKSNWSNGISVNKIFWKFNLDEITKEDKTLYIKNILNDNNIKIDSKCSLLDSMNSMEYKDIEQELMNILIKYKTNKIDKITNKTLAELEFKKYLKSKSNISIRKNTSKGILELKNFQGLDKVKEQIYEILNFLKVNKKRETTMPSLHMAFYGNPRSW